ncbi:MAG: hypothetical protein L7S70_07505, partial [Pseudomonadales bacterium]|nr:hypothetical protein [Pseudomonadales bacterium]
MNMDNGNPLRESAMKLNRWKAAAISPDSRFKQVLVTTITLLLLQAGVNAQTASTLSEVRALYQQYTPENFDDGGAVSHYVWKNFVSFFPHATIARTSAIRELEVQANPALADFEVNAGQDTT